MDFFSNPIIAAVILILLLVFVHETGHFLVGRICGIAVEMFSIGFGPPILSWQRGATNYRISWIPLGGFVKFYGMLPGEDVPEGIGGVPFNKASLPRRTATVAAGPLANFFLAFLVYTGMGMDGISHHQPIVGEVQSGSPALEAGLQFEDQIVAIDSKQIQTWVEMSEIISKSPGKRLAVTALREGKAVDLEIVPEAVEAVDLFGNPGKIGRIGIVYQATPAVVALTPADSPARRADLRTGDKIVAAMVSGEWREIKYFRKFIKVAINAISEGQEAIAVKVETTTGELKESQIKLAGIRAKELKEHPDRVARDLGFESPQLLIGKVDDVAKGILQQRDRLIEWNGQSVRSQVELAQLIIENEQPVIPVKVVRGDQIVELDLPHEEVTIQRPDGKKVLYRFPVSSYLGDSIELPAYVEKYDNIFSAMWFGAKETAIQATFLAATLGRLISGDVPLKALGGPMLIAKVASDAAKRGIKDYLGTMALISVNLGVLNLFPIPALDGGQLVIFLVEAVRRKRLSEVAVENFQKVGFVMIMALVVLAVYNDLSRFWTSMLKSVVGMFN